jgi:CheY-like chemotaxis protein
MPPPRIAILEDEEEVRALWLEALEDAGYAAEGFGSGAGLLERVTQRAPDLILLDMMMPGMDGYEFLARLRANPTSPRIPLLIISGIGASLDLSIDDEGARTLGVAAILSKPVDLPTLIEHVERVVGPPHR